MGSHSRPTSDAQRLARYLRTHQSAITATELRTLGFGKDAITGLVQDETLIRQHRGVYRSGHAAPQRETLLRCGLLAVGDDAALSHASAAHHLGLIDFAPKLPEIIVPRKGAGRTRANLVVHETADLPRRHVRIVDGLRCAVAERTILDLAATTRTGPQFKLLRRAARQATVKQKHLPQRWASIIEERGSFRGSRILATVLDEHLETTAVLRSDLEAAFLDLCRQAGIPLPETNATVEGHEVDAAWRFAKVIIELDTYAFHGDVRSFERDRIRDAELTVAGYRTIRITQRRLEREAGTIVRQIRTLLAL